MADINTAYGGVLEYYDPKTDSGIINPHTLNWFGGGGSNYWISELPIWEKLDKVNNDSAATVAAVKVPFNSSQDRTKWLNERLAAINNRVAFIKSRVDGILQALKESGNTTYDALEKGAVTAIGLIPIIGSVATFAYGKEQQSKALDEYKMQSLVQQYTTDLGQLAEIRKQLTTELATASATNDPTNNAPTVTNIWFYVAGIVLLLGLIFWIKKRKKSRKR